MSEEITIPTNKIDINKEFLNKWQSFRDEAEANGEDDLVYFLDEILSQFTSMAGIITTYINYIALAEKTITELSAFMKYNIEDQAEDDPELENVPEEVQKMVQRSLSLLNYMQAYVEKINLDKTETPLQ